MFFTVLIYLSYLLYFIFCIVCLACGLYYLSELIEEQAYLAKRFIKYTICFIIGAIFLLWIFEDLSSSCLFLSLLCHCAYLTLLPEFPFVTLTSPKFIVSIVTFVISHFSWFFYFRENWFPFEQIISIFTIFVWLVPLILFISLAASDNSLPRSNISSSSSSSSRIIGVDSDFTSSKRSRVSVLKSGISWVNQKIQELTGSKSANKHYY
ncbi:hypothetical protein CYY_002297 [Polysphondylium violaceum]|uniref:Transmembrane protein n=1 Tax=Polysphondylium violaceum TaxID=133409 RepID=A0A8J4Q1I2_9MYCE|nr:hypothetical protein CYY_002297 [Polysphondylium violaceum]